MVKWLTRITVSTEESDSYYHYYDNRLLPSMVDPERAEREDWWHRPDYIINDLNLNSAITHPVSKSMKWAYYFDYAMFFLIKLSS